MNLNLISYLLFYPAMVAIAVWTAQVSHRHGRIWMLRIFHEAPFVDAVNNILLVGCYMVNAGYAALMVATWGTVESVPALIAMLCERIAIILLTLAALHHINIAVLLIWSRIISNTPIKQPTQ